MAAGPQLYQSGTAAAMFDFSTRANADRVFMLYRDREILYSDVRREVSLEEIGRRLEKSTVRFRTSSSLIARSSRDREPHRDLHRDRAVAPRRIVQVAGDQPVQVGDVALRKVLGSA